MLCQIKSLCERLKNSVKEIWPKTNMFAFIKKKIGKGRANYVSPNIDF